MPAFESSDARLYWAAADSHGAEQRHSTDRPDLARSFAAHVTASELPYPLAVHAGLSKQPGVADNPHLHLVFSERVNDGVARAAEQWFRSGGAGGREPGVRGRDEERVHEATDVAAGAGAGNVAARAPAAAGPGP